MSEKTIQLSSELKDGGKMGVGERIKRYRKAGGYTQRGLA